MPRYTFECTGCAKREIKTISADIVNNNKDWNKVKCPNCLCTMDLVFDVDAIPNFIFKGVPPFGKEVQLKREAKKATAVFDEGFTSSMEIEEGEGLAKDEEKKRGMTPGTLTGNIKAVTTKEEKEKIVKRDIVKKELSRKARSKMGLR